MKVSETRAYDARLRLNTITDGSVYTLSIPATGGYALDSDILTANDSVNGNWAYTYDAFNRLASATATGQAYTYAYDRFGNRWQQNGPHSSQPGFDANNHIVPGGGVTYDAAGDTTDDGTTAYTYDAEGRIITATNSISGSSSYVYGPEGTRIGNTTTAGGTVDFLYDIAGHEIAQITLTGTWMRGEIYVGNRHLTTPNNGTTYYDHSDWLGTERARSTSTGSPYETCTSLPFGDWLTCTGGDPSPMHFTGKEHDTESGLENFGARYDSSQYGRFMTPDWSGKPQGVPYANFGDPQSLDLYAYVGNNPIGGADPDGHCALCDNIFNFFFSTANDPPPSPPPPPPPGEMEEFTSAPAAQQHNNSNQHSNSKHTATRLVMAGEAAVNLAIAYGKGKAAMALGELASDSGGATAVPAGLLLMSASGNVAAAGVQAVGAVSGETEDAETAAKAATTMTTASGFLTLVGTQGDLDRASKYAAREGILTTDPRELLGGSLVDRTAKLIDYFETLGEGGLFH